MTRLPRTRTFVFLACWLLSIPQFATSKFKIFQSSVESNKQLLADIDFVGLSADTTFALDRFKKEKSLSDDLLLLSDAKDHAFGFKTGTQINELGLLTRTTFVVDKNNTIVYLQRVPELTTIPDLEKAVEVAKKHL